MAVRYAAPAPAGLTLRADCLEGRANDGTRPGFCSVQQVRAADGKPVPFRAGQVVDFVVVKR